MKYIPYGEKDKSTSLIGVGLYIRLKLSYFFGVSGEIILSIKGKRKWIENTGYSRLM